MTIMAQASPHREQVIEGNPQALDRFYEIHHDEYIPVQHAMMFLSLVGMVSALHSLWARWPDFKNKKFSPAHMAFVFPLLSHTNAVQAYRSGVNAFAGIPEHSPFKIMVSPVSRQWFLPCANTCTKLIAAVRVLADVLDCWDCCKHSIHSEVYLSDSRVDTRGPSGRQALHKS